MLTALLLVLAGSDEFVITETVRTKPAVTMITADGNWCVYCNKADKDLAEAKDLPFTINRTTERPAWVTVVPVFVFDTPNGKMQIEGYSNLDVLVKGYEYAQKVPAKRSAPAPTLPAPVQQYYYVPTSPRRFRLFR